MTNTTGHDYYCRSFAAELAAENLRDQYGTEPTADEAMTTGLRYLEEGDAECCCD